MNPQTVSSELSALTTRPKRPATSISYFGLQRIPPEEGLAALARDGVEVVAEGLVAAHGALLGGLRVLRRPGNVTGRIHDLTSDPSL